MIIVILILMIASMVLFLVKIKNMLSFWMLTLYIGTFMVVLGYMYYYAKSGGINGIAYTYLFLHEKIARYLMYSPIPLDIISRFIVWGRSIFIFSNACFAIEVYQNRTLKERKGWVAFAAIFPILNIVCYEPKIYRMIFIDYNPWLNQISRFAMVLNTLISIFLIVVKYRKINIPWIKKQLKYILFAIISINILFYSFGFFGPMQIAYPNTLWYVSSTFDMFKSSTTVINWYLLLASAVLFSATGFISLWNYAKVEKQIGKPDMFIERKLKTAHMGAKIFTHGIKNQLLVSRVMLKRIKNEVNQENWDREKVVKSVSEMEQINEQMLNRMDSLYKTFKTNALSLKPANIKDIVNGALSKLENKNEVIEVKVREFSDAIILADYSHLTEAVYNIITNGIDAIKAKGNSENGVVEIKCYSEHSKILLHIHDNGIGIDKSKINKIFDPFYTDKNTNNNWGVGLSHAQQIIDNHFGYIRIDSETGEGTTFFIVLPIYRLN